MWQMAGMNSSNPLKNTPHYRWKNSHTDASPEPEAPKESIPMCKPSFFSHKKWAMDRVDFFLGVGFLAKGQERNHISHPIQQKESMNSWANCYEFWTWGDSLTKTTNWGDLVWGRYNLPRMTGLHQRQLVVSTCFRTHLKKITHIRSILPKIFQFRPRNKDDNKKFFELSPGKTWRNSFFATTKTWEFSSPHRINGIFPYI